MRKKLISVIALFTIILLCTSPVFALTINTGDTENSEGTETSEQSSNGVVAGVTTMELVEKNICEIDMKDSTTNDDVGNFTKELTDFDASKKESILTLTVKNIMEQEVSTKPIELYLVLDNSDSMKNTYQEKSKKEYVIEVANKFVDSLFEKFDNAKVGIVSFTCVQPVSSETGEFTDGTLDDAKLLLALSDSKETVKTKISEYETSELGKHTNIEAGLALADANFTSSTESAKYIILISDGVPNLCLDTETTLQYSGKIATNTKNKLQELETKGYHIYSVLTGLADADVENPNAPIVESTGKNMTYRELAQEIFGTADNPTAGDFFYIDYTNLDDTINTDIYEDITSVKDNTLKNIVIKDYFPQEIVDNFNFEYVKSPNIGKVSEKIDTSDNSITWNIELLNAGEVATLSYKLTLKDDYDKAIVDKILPTNTKVDINYKYNDKDENANSTVSPTIRVKYSESSTDDTVAKKAIPQAGIYSTVLLAVAIVGIVVFAIIKRNQIKKLK